MISLTVIGDVNVEINGSIDVPFSRIDHNILDYGPLEMRIGGTAPNLAEAAAGRFSPIRVVGCVGSDELGTWAEHSLKKIGVDARLQHDPALPTGLAVSIRDGTAPGGRRLLIVRSENANRMLDSAHITGNSTALTQAGVFVTDGYSLLAEPRRGATLEAMRVAATAGAQVVVDVVPHDCYRLIDELELSKWLASAHVVVVEVRTMRRFFGLSTPPGDIDLSVALETLEHLQSIFRDRSFLLRFGVQEVSESLVCQPDRKPIHRHIDFTGGRLSHNFGDVLTVDELTRYFF
ncbi:MAG TPA: carbohydrate kinase family protein [Streptosporangiaceae bacterium]|nr:carbohydrate kinase family protein [Streptosporangiaceae bacterium]